MSDPDRQFCGLATVWGPPENWDADTFRPWVSLRMGVPLKLGHEAVIFASGAVLERVGQVTDSALVDEASSHPGGLLVFGFLDPGPVGDRVLADTRNPRPHRRPWGLSVAAAVLHEGARVELALPWEISLTQRPAYPQALILGVGDRAARVWDLLTPARPGRTAPAAGKE
jgi:hypothetical protein